MYEHKTGDSRAAFKSCFCKVFCGVRNKTQYKFCENECVVRDMFTSKYKNRPFKQLFDCKTLYKRKGKSTASYKSASGRRFKDGA